MQLIHLNPSPILNLQEQSFQNCSDQKAFFAYEKIYEAIDLFSKNNKFLTYDFYNHNDLFPSFINAEKFYNFCQQKGTSMLKENFCLGDPMTENLFYLDKETKDDLIEYLTTFLREYEDQLDKMEKDSKEISDNTIDKKYEIPFLKEQIKDIKETIKNIQYFYDRKMLLFFIF